jgi:hypothetical protein
MTMSDKYSSYSNMALWFRVAQLYYSVYGRDGFDERFKAWLCTKPYSTTLGLSAIASRIAAGWDDPFRDVPGGDDK